MIFFSYGLPKSASSFVYRITHSAFESRSKSDGGKVHLLENLFEGFPKTNLAEKALAEGFKIEAPNPRDVDKFASYLDELYIRLQEKLDANSGDAIVIKTHLPCSPLVAEAIKNGEVLASATYRHPAEMILSRMDMAKRLGETLNYDLKKFYLNEVNKFNTWSKVTQVRTYYYDDIALRPQEVANDIYHHVGSQDDPSSFLDEFLITIKETKLSQFNKGVINRHAQEMSEAEITEIELLFSDFMRYIKKHKSINGEPA